MQTVRFQMHTMHRTIQFQLLSLCEQLLQMDNSQRMRVLLSHWTISAQHKRILPRQLNQMRQLRPQMHRLHRLQQQLHQLSTISRSKLRLSLQYNYV